MASSGTLTLYLERRAGLPPEQALERARAAARVGDAAALITAFYLADLADRKAFRELGAASLRDLAARELGLKSSTAKEYVSVGRAIHDLPAIEAALVAGRLDWSRTRKLTRVATPETEAAWIAWAVPRNAEQVGAGVVGRRKGDLPTSPRRRVDTVTVEARARLSPTEALLWRNAQEKLAAELGVDAVTDKQLMLEGARLLLATRPDGSVKGRTPVADGHYVVHVDVDPDDRATAPGPGGEPVEVDLGALARPGGLPDRAEAPRVEARAAPAPTSLAGLAASLDPENSGAPAPEALRALPTSPELRKAVLSRDGHRCRCCGGRGGLTVHHRRWRRYGGATAAENLITLCRACHSLVHDRYLFVVAVEPRGVRFLDRRGRPVDGPPRPGAPIPVGPGAPAPAARAAPAGAGDVVGLEDLPDVVDAAWWARYGHLLLPSGRGRELELRPGRPRDVAADRPGEAGPVGAPDPEAGRPLADLVGQARLREELGVALQAARLRGEAAPHLLLSGPPGLGKTHLAAAIAAELGGPFVRFTASPEETPASIRRALAGLRAGAVFFVDELQSLERSAAEALYRALDEGVVELVVRAGAAEKRLTLKLAPFTFVGATTDDDCVPSAFRSRLLPGALEFYAPEELAEILRRAADGRGLELAPEAGAALAAAARDTPRDALRLLAAARDEATVRGVDAIDGAVVGAVLARLGVDAGGLTERDRRYLGALRSARSGAASLGSLAARLGLTRSVVTEVVEPFLLRRGLIELTPRGRVLTTQGLFRAGEAGTAARSACA